MAVNLLGHLTASVSLCHLSWLRSQSHFPLRDFLPWNLLGVIREDVLSSVAASCRQGCGPCPYKYGSLSLPDVGRQGNGVWDWNREAVSWFFQSEAGWSVHSIILSMRSCILSEAKLVSCSILRWLHLSSENKSIPLNCWVSFQEAPKVWPMLCKQAIRYFPPMKTRGKKMKVNDHSKLLTSSWVCKPVVCQCF